MKDSGLIQVSYREPSYTPWKEMNHWRRRFWCLVAIDLLALVILWLRSLE